MRLHEMTIEDYDAVMRLLSATSGVQLRDADSREVTSRYLQRNPGLSFVAFIDDHLVGCVMCGHDGRRGYLQHLAVSERFRRRGVGSALLEACLAKLESHGILKTHIDVLVGNEGAITYWTRRGWKKRDDILRFSFVRNDNANV